MAVDRPHLHLVHNAVVPQHAVDHRLLTADEEVDLGRRIQVGIGAEAARPFHAAPDEVAVLERLIADGHRARRTLVEHNVRLVLGLVSKHRSRTYYDDAVQDGCEALDRAARRFDPERGFRFATFARTYVVPAVKKSAARSMHPVTVPERTAIRMSALAKASADLQKDLGRPATDDEVADLLGWTVEEVRSLGLRGRIHMSDIDHDSDARTHGRFGVTDGGIGRLVERAGDAELVGHLLTFLDERQRTVILMQYGFDRDEPATLSEIGAVLGVTRERARQIAVAALGRMRHPVLVAAA